jgi:hypothetical protein
MDLVFIQVLANQDRSQQQLVHLDLILRSGTGYEFYLQAGTLKNLAKMMGDSIKFWKDCMHIPTMMNGGRHAMQEMQCIILNLLCLLLAVCLMRKIVTAHGIYTSN